MKAGTQIAIAVGTIVVSVLFVLIAKGYNPMQKYDGYTTDRVLYVNPQTPAHRIELQKRLSEDESTEEERIVIIKPGLLGAQITPVSLDTLNYAEWQYID